MPARQVPRRRAVPGALAASQCVEVDRLVIDGDTIAEVPRTTSQEISRYKA
jgi:hypothetical protein